MNDICFQGGKEFERTIEKNLHQGGGGIRSDFDHRLIVSGLRGQ